MAHHPARIAATVLAAAALIVTLTGCTSPKTELQTECRQAVADHAGVELSDVVINEKSETPGGSLDYSGTYPGGDFACGAGLQEKTLYQVMVYLADGTVESVPLP